MGRNRTPDGTAEGKDKKKQLGQKKEKEVDLRGGNLGSRNAEPCDKKEKV